MTTFVDSAAGGLNDGTSWTDAYTSLASTTGVAAGELIYVDDGHSQNFNTSTSLGWSNGTVQSPVVILSVDKADNGYSPGALIDNGSGASGFFTLFLSGNIWVAGMTFKTSHTMNFATNNNFQRFHECSFFLHKGSSGFNLGNGSSFTAHRLRFEDCTFDAGGTGAANVDVMTIAYSFVELVACIWTNLHTTAHLIHSAGANRINVVRVRDSDLSGFTALCDFTSDGTGLVLISTCKTPTTLTLNSAKAPLVDIICENCEDGTISVPPLGLTRSENGHGYCAATLARYRTGGADDGEQANAYSFEMVSDANAKVVVSFVEMPPIIRWVTGGVSITAKIFVASGVTLNDDDFWWELCSPNEIASPNQTAQGNFISTRNPFAVPVALTTDSVSTWTGTGVGTKQEISRTFTPTESGIVVVRCFLARPSTTVYVDPKVEIT